MQKTFTVVAIATLILAFVSSANADLLTGGLVSGQYLSFQTTSNGETRSSAVGHMNVTNLTSDTAFKAFCGDHSTYTSSDFSNSSKGQAYGAYSLWDASLTIYSDQQKTDINNVFGYLYGLGFDTETGNVTNSTTAIAMQLMIWEILGDGGTGADGNGFDLSSGDFIVHQDSLTTAQQAVIDKVAEYSTMLINDDWGNLLFSDYNMTVYVAEGGMYASQTLISIENTAVPEPASMLIFGAGLAFGAPMIRRRLKNRNKKA